MELVYFRGVFSLAATLCPTLPWTAESEVLLLTIAGQESGWVSRLQIGGPAHSYWQFDPGTIGLLLQNATTGPLLAEVCKTMDISAPELWAAITWNDVLAMIMARLLLWANPQSLPAMGDAAGAYSYYIATWRPGAPKASSWPDLYQLSMTAMS